MTRNQADKLARLNKRVETLRVKHTNQFLNEDWVGMQATLTKIIKTLDEIHQLKEWIDTSV